MATVAILNVMPLSVLVTCLIFQRYNRAKFD